MEEPRSAETPDVLRARCFEVLDDHGAVRAVLGRHPNPNAEDPPIYGLSVLDGRGAARLWLALSPTGPNLAFDLDGTLAVELGVQDPRPDAVRAGPFLQLSTPDGFPVVVWRVEDQRTAVFPGRPA